ncbi:MAG: hypothetical protein WBF90_13990 [Rivularia sp. (in: cyanobacteria)]|jgi:hypothetical protein
MTEESQNSNYELLAEYKFDYNKAKPNRFVNRRYFDPVSDLVTEATHREGVNNS